MVRQVIKLDQSHIEPLVRLLESGKDDSWTRDALLSELTLPWATVYGIYQDHGLNEEFAAYLDYWLTADMIDVINITTHPAYRQQGYARMLMERLIQDARSCGVTWITLEVRISNAPAISLYKSLGFQETGIRHKYYADGEDGMLMDLHIVPPSAIHELKVRS